MHARVRAVPFAAALLCAFAFVGTSARAGDAEAAAALQKFEAGRALFDGTRYDESLLAFRDSYSLQPSPNSRLYIARCLAKLGKVATAYVNFRFTAREANDRLVATGERRYALTRDAATEEGADLESRVPRLTIAVPAGLPQEFTVKLNGAPVERSAWGVAVETDPAHVIIEAAGPRLRPFRVELDLAEGQQRRVEVLAGRIPTAIVTLRFGARPQGLAVALDGAPIDPADLSRARELDVGAHAVDATAPGYLPFRWTKDLADAERAEVAVDLAQDPSRAPSRGTPRWAFYSTVGAAAVSLGVGGYFGVRAFVTSKDELAKDPLARDPSRQQLIQKLSSTADVFLVTGLVLGAGATVLGFTTDWRATPAKPTMGIAPWMTAGGGGVSAAGAF